MKFPSLLSVSLSSLFAIIFWSLLCPNIVYAMEFSEIAYDIPGSDDKHEWVELFNNDSTPFDLAGDYFYDGSYHLLNPVGENNLSLQPNERVVLTDDAPTFLSDHDGFTGKIIDTTMSLRNYSKDLTEPIALKLANDKKELITEVKYLPTLNGSSGLTLEKKSDGQWLDSVSSGGTPGQVNSEVKKIDHPIGIRLSEFMSNPGGDDSNNEWIEIENTTENNITIDGWYVRDKETSSGRVNRFILPTSLLSPHSFTVFTISGSILNNKDEVVNFYWPDNSLIESISLPGEAKDNWTYARFDSEWDWTDQATPSKINLRQIVATPTSQGSSNPTPTLSSFSKKAIETVEKIVASSPTPTEEKVKKPLVASLSGGSKATTPPKKKETKLTATLTSGELSSPPPSVVASAFPIGASPTALERVAGITTTQSHDQKYWLIIIFIFFNTLLLAALAIFKFKLLRLIPHLKNLNQTDIIT